MSEKRIIYPNDEGGVSIVIPAPDCGLTLKQIEAKDVPQGKPRKTVDVSEIPSDRTFRDAWEYSEDGIEINITKAKEIWKNEWRKARSKKFPELDILFMRAIEENDTSEKNRIADLKQDLRDVTLTPIPGSTPEEIKSVWPEILD